MEHTNELLDPKILETLSDEERQALVQIMGELQNGDATTLNHLWQQDYDEIPVSIDQFIEDPEYLGNATNNGTSIFPFWRHQLREWFGNPDGSPKYMEVILSGAIGIGKTTIADVGLCYLLYRLLCLKNPQAYYGLTRSSIMTVAFINVDLNLAYGVTYSKMQAMLMDSPWFLKHGSVVGNKNEVYVPGKNIEFRVGSNDKHILGTDTFCLSGDTVIATTDGTYPISSLVDRTINVIQHDTEGNTCISEDCTVVKTKEVTELLELELEDGTLIRCTPDHRFRLTDGTYKCACDLTGEEDLAFVQSDYIPR